MAAATSSSSSFAMENQAAEAVVAIVEEDNALVPSRRSAGVQMVEQSVVPEVCAEMDAAANTPAVCAERMVATQQEEAKEGELQEEEEETELKGDIDIDHGFDLSAVSAISTSHCFSQDDDKQEFVLPARAFGRQQQQQTPSEPSNPSSSNNNVDDEENDRTISALNVAIHPDHQNDDDNNTVEALDVAEAPREDDPSELPNYKDQVQEWRAPRAPPPRPFARNASDSSPTATTRTPSTQQAFIPVAQATHIGDSTTTDPPREGGDGGGPEASLGGTNTNNNSDKAPSQVESQSERKFWLLVISVALCLNTFLVGAIVVGSFCMAGRCGASSSESSMVDIPPPPPTLPNIPSFPTVVPFPESPTGPLGGGGTLVPTVSAAPSSTPYPTPAAFSSGFVPPPTIPTAETTSAPPVVDNGRLRPTPAPSDDSDVEDNDPRPEKEPSTPEEEDSNNDTAGSSDDQQSLYVGVLVLGSILVEALILLGVCVAHRRRQQQRRIHDNAPKGSTLDEASSEDDRAGTDHALTEDEAANIMVEDHPQEGLLTMEEDDEELV